MDFFNFLFTKKAPPSRNIASDRLKMAIAYDRVDCSPQLLEMIRADVVKVISNYVEINEAESVIEIAPITEGNPLPVLYANIAITNMRKVHV